MDRKQTLINEWTKTVNLFADIENIFCELETESYYVGQTLSVSAFVTDRLFKR